MTDSLLLSLLPDVVAVSVSSSPPLRALAAVADDMHVPVHRVLDRVDRVVDPYRTPDSLVPYLSRWVDLDWLTVQGADAAAGPALGVSLPRSRDLLANAADLSARRGTPAGLRRFLFLATGHNGFEVIDVVGEFHVVVRVPAEAADSLELIERIVAVLKPAHVTSEVELLPAASPAEVSTGGADV